MPGIGFLRQRQDNTFAIREYLLAIRALLKPEDIASDKFIHHAAVVGASNVTVDVCLISCILFTCFEILSGHYGPAINHVRSGIAILGEVYYDPSSGTFRHPHLQPSTVTILEMENMRKIFIRLQGQASTLTRADMDNPAPDSGEIPATPHVSIEVQESYSSIAEARDDFESINWKCIHHYHRIMRSVPAAEAPDTSAYLLQQYGTLLHKWCTALAHFEMSRGESLTSKERMGLQLLNIYKHNIIMYYEYARSTEAALLSSEENASFSWDEYNSRFAEIVSLAASVVEATHDTDSPISNPFDSLNSASQSRPFFSLDNGVVGPLYNVATLCRDPIIRRRAVHVLRLARRQEGVFNSHLCAIVAEKVIEIEEAAAASECHNDYPLLECIVSEDEKLERPAAEIAKGSEVPDTVRLTYAYPKFDLVKKQIFLTIGQSMKMHVDIPWPAMNFLIDMGN